MKRGVFYTIVCMLLAALVAPGASAGRQVQPDRAATSTALFHDDFEDTSGLEEMEAVVAEGSYLQVPEEVTWLQDTFADFYPGSGVGVDLYSVPGAIILSRFSPNVRVNDVAIGAQVQVDAASAPSNAPPTAYIYAAWADGRDGDLDIYFSRSTDGGATWEANRKLNLLAGAGDQKHPAIAALGDRVHVVWEDAAGIHHTHSQDCGATWQSDSLLVSGGGEPDIAVGSSATSSLAYLLYVAEESPGDPDIFCLRSADDGASWGRPENVVAGEPAGAIQRAPSVAMVPSQDEVWAAWEDDRDGDMNIYAGRRLPSFWNNLRVDGGPAGSIQGLPALFFSPGYVLPMCLWTDDRNGTGNIYGAIYDSGNLKWVEFGPLSGPGASAPAAATFDTVSWAAWTSAPPGAYDTAWLRRYDGLAWGPPLLAPDHRPYVTRSSVAAARADVTQAAVAALWSDDRGDSGDIFAASSDGTYQAAGVYTSTAHGFGDPASWGEISWTGGDLGNIVVEVRTGNTPTPDPGWSAWTAATNGGLVPAPAAGYLQYRVSLYRTVTGGTPLLESVQIVGYPRRGWGISVPLGQCVVAWDELTSGGYTPPGTTLTLSVLDITATALYSDVTTPFDLSTIPATQYPRLRLRVDMERSPTNTPLLDWWQVTWVEGATHAAFSFDPQSIYTPTVVQFTNHSTGTVTPTAFLWEFGDGVTTTVESPAHGYSVSGTYTVTLRASGECGEDVATASLTVQPLPAEPPVAAFSHGPLCPAEEVAFTDESSRAIWWQWAFGDGAVSTLQNPTHVYTASGDYSLTLTVSNTVGSDQAAELLAVRPAPTAAFTWTAEVLTVAFSATVSGDPALLWSFGDGLTATVPYPTHSYAAAGSYTVTLSAANACAAALVADVVTVSCAPVTATAFTWAPPEPEPGDVVTFTATASGSPPLAFTWDLYSASGRGAVVTHTYAISGTFPVTLTVENPCGSATVTHSVRVAPCTKPAGLEVIYAPQPPRPGQPVFFTATLAGGSIPLAYVWTFGDGTPPASGSHVTHTYAAVGTYIARVVVENDCGSAQGSAPVEVGYRVYLPLTAHTFYSGDTFEPDDPRALARWLPLDSLQWHDFAPQGDTDWVYVDLTDGETYHFETTNLTSGVDTILDLYFGMQLVAHDDDSCNNRAACFDYSPTVVGRYHLRVTQYLGEAQWGPGAVYTLQVVRK